jgi:F0F1-type ATP synthase alpha subunit
LPIAKVRPFLSGFCEYLSSKRPSYGQIIRDTNALNKEAEELLKKALTDYQKEFSV